ncbi:MAG: MerR family transcriptional regulator [Roseibium sp.]
MSTQDKSPDAFRTISEVAEDLDLPQHVLRFWETRFTQIKPLKRGGGRRYYRPDDVELLKGIRHLLYGEGYTIKGVQRILKEQGPRYVMQIWREDADPAQGAVDATNASLAGQNGAASTDVADHQTTAPRQTKSEKLPDGVLADGTEDAAHGAPSGLGILGRLRGEKPETPVPAAQSDVSKDDVRRLQSTLFELLECKRTLDQAR